MSVRHAWGAKEARFGLYSSHRSPCDLARDMSVSRAIRKAQQVTGDSPKDHRRVREIRIDCQGLLRGSAKHD